MNEIVGNTVVKARTVATARQGSMSSGGGFAGHGLSVSANYAEEKAESTRNERSSTSFDGTVDIEASAEGKRNVISQKNKAVMDQTILEVQGGSHRIASSITDLYSLNFRSGLYKWLTSIPFYTYPFNMKFETIPNMMKHLVDDMIDADMYAQCIVRDNQEGGQNAREGDAANYAIIQREQRISVRAF